MTGGQRSDEQIHLKELQRVTAELRYSVRGGVSLPRHFHNQYQLIISEHRLIEYRYRGAFEKSPLGTLFLIEPGEVHSTAVLANTDFQQPLRTLLIPGLFCAH